MPFTRADVHSPSIPSVWPVCSYIVQYRYQVKGRDRFALYFWQGRDSSITEKGAAAVETINVSDALGGDIPQIRVEQGKETRQFLRLFHVNGGMVVHLGDQAAPPSDAAVRLYQLRQAEHGDVRCIETDSPGPLRRPPPCRRGPDSRLPEDNGVVGRAPCGSVGVPFGPRHGGPDRHAHVCVGRQERQSRCRRRVESARRPAGERGRARYGGHDENRAQSLACS